MDELTLRVLLAEMGQDAKVVADAARTARERLEAGSPAGVEGAGYHLARAYNALEQMMERVARAFENQIDNRSGWHRELVRRLSLAIPGVRPPLFPPALLPELQELRAFRHVFRHAYDLPLQAARLEPLVDAAQRVADGLPDCIHSFAEAVAAQEGWQLS